MYTEEVRSQREPKEIEINTIDHEKEVWMRRNIRQEPVHFEDDGTLEYVYEEIYFRTSASEEELKADPEFWWNQGKDWHILTPETDKEKITRLERELTETNTRLTQIREDSDMAVAELSMAMALMM